VTNAECLIMRNILLQTVYSMSVEMLAVVIEELQINNFHM